VWLATQSFALQCERWDLPLTGLRSSSFGCGEAGSGVSGEGFGELAGQHPNRESLTFRGQKTY
jgi:hypothetical protein